MFGATVSDVAPSRWDEPTAGPQKRCAAAMHAGGRVESALGAMEQLIEELANGQSPARSTVREERGLMSVAKIWDNTPAAWNEVANRIEAQRARLAELFL